MAKNSSAKRNARRRKSYARQRAAQEVTRAERERAEQAQEAAARVERANDALRERYGFSEPHTALEDVRRRWERVERRRAELLVERDDLVQHCRELGMSWAELSRELGVSRQALMKRD